VDRLPNVVRVSSWPLVPRNILDLSSRLAYKFLKVGDAKWMQSRIRSELKEAGCEVVLAEYGHVGAEIAEACWQLKIPLVVHFHGFDAHQNSHVAEYLERYQSMFQKASAIIVVSNTMKKALEKIGADPDVLHTIHYGVNCEHFSHNKNPDSNLSFLTVGRFTEKKAPHLTIKAFSKIADDFPEIQLRMIGNGPLLDNCVDLAKSLALEARIEFLGEKNHEEVAQAMATARCFVQHSIRAPSGDCEGLPLAILEASASGLPVISTIHAGIPEVIEHEVSGFLSNEGDVESMAKHMAIVASDDATVSRLGCSGRKIIEEKFSLHRYISELSSLLQRVSVG